MKLITILIFTFISFTAFSQDQFFQNSDASAAENSEIITESYNEQLAMTTQQRLLFKKKVEEFLIRAQKIEKEYTGKEKLDMLLALQMEETREMNNILTRPQMTVYKEMKTTVQPIDTIKKED
ncbi:hypothetical protein [Aequorivita echinoideorum]|uniref:DUF4168 domain-containing protein n=1 Tax=Aequorivita echinoideorum TaxID=1549647 RepID=A0ABS5S674_9FLAO|nr:hypothetical protein [Aequorivita echinoideorum]MBT0608679.1 hypothetical protein [Aequorivita echinoideorum]